MTTERPDAGQVTWRDQLRTALRFSEGQPMIARLSGDPSALANAWHVLKAERPDVLVSRSADVLVEAPVGSTILLVPALADATTLQARRPVVATRRLAVLVFLDDADLPKWLMDAPDFFDWATLRLVIPHELTGLQRRVVASLRRAVSAGAHLMVAAEARADASELFPDAVELDASADVEALLEAARGREVRIWYGARTSHAYFRLTAAETLLGSGVVVLVGVQGPTASLSALAPVDAARAPAGESPGEMATRLDGDLASLPSGSAEVFAPDQLAFDASVWASFGRDFASMARVARAFGLPDVASALERRSEPTSSLRGVRAELETWLLERSSPLRRHLLGIELAAWTARSERLRWLGALLSWAVAQPYLLEVPLYRELVFSVALVPMTRWSWSEPPFTARALLDTLLRGWFVAWVTVTGVALFLGWSRLDTPWRIASALVWPVWLLSWNQWAALVALCRTTGRWWAPVLPTLYLQSTLIRAHVALSHGDEAHRALALASLDDAVERTRGGLGGGSLSAAIEREVQAFRTRLRGQSVNVPPNHSLQALFGHGDPAALSNFRTQLHACAAALESGQLDAIATWRQWADLGTFAGGDPNLPRRMDLALLRAGRWKDSPWGLALAEVRAGSDDPRWPRQLEQAVNAADPEVVGVLALAIADAWVAAESPGRGVPFLRRAAAAAPKEERAVLLVRALELLQGLAETRQAVELYRAEGRPLLRELGRVGDLARWDEILGPWLEPADLA